MDANKVDRALPATYVKGLQMQVFVVIFMLTAACLVEVLSR